VAIAGKMRRPAAGKTGTSKRPARRLVRRLHPRPAGGGLDRLRRHEEARAAARTGGKAAAPIWADFMAKATARPPTKDFTQPPGIVVQRIDKASGLLAAPGQESARSTRCSSTAPRRPNTPPPAAAKKPAPTNC
jgi:penicillin-binding protein 1A